MSINFENLYKVDMGKDFFSKHSLTTNLKIRKNNPFGSCVSLILRENLNKEDLVKNITGYIDTHEKELKALGIYQIDKLSNNILNLNNELYENKNTDLTQAASKLKSITIENQKIYDHIISIYGREVSSLTFTDSATPVIFKRTDNPKQLLQKIANQYTVDQLYQDLGKKRGQEILRTLYPEEFLVKFRSGELPFGHEQLTIVENYRTSLKIRNELEKSFDKECIEKIFSQPFVNPLFKISEDEFQSTAKAFAAFAAPRILAEPKITS